jgi:peptidoglycan/xylan/chitin deacetylase (PgdA/CDA1 family)
MSAQYLGALPDPGRFDYLPIHRRRGYRWPNGSGLAVYLGFNLEHFAFGEGLGACIGPVSPPPDVLNHAWREYGNRVGAWRCLELFDRLGLPAATVLNSALIEHAPDLVAACVARGDELVGHGHSNAERQGALDEAGERELLLHCRERLRSVDGKAPAGWLSPWISESRVTPDLLAEAGYRYTLNWCHDPCPGLRRSRSGSERTPGSRQGRGRGSGTSAAPDLEQDLEARPEPDLREWRWPARTAVGRAKRARRANHDCARQERSYLSFRQLDAVFGPHDVQSHFDGLAAAIDANQSGSRSRDCIVHPHDQRATPGARQQVRIQIRHVPRSEGLLRGLWERRRNRAITSEVILFMRWAR